MFGGQKLKLFRWQLNISLSLSHWGRFFQNDGNAVFSISLTPLWIWPLHSDDGLGRVIGFGFVKVTQARACTCPLPLPENMCSVVCWAAGGKRRIGEHPQLSPGGPPKSGSQITASGAGKQARMRAAKPPSWPPKQGSTALHVCRPLRFCVCYISLLRQYVTDTKVVSASCAHYFTIKLMKDTRLSGKSSNGESIPSGWEETCEPVRRKWLVLFKAFEYFCEPTEIL